MKAVDRYPGPSVVVWSLHTTRQAPIGFNPDDMAAKILPDDGELAGLVPAPGSVTWRKASDARVLGGAGYALALQVAHPTVGAGVAQFSSFAVEPWGRLLRTLDYVNGTIYGGPQLAGESGRRVRNVHKSIKGVKANGEQFHALEPEAFAWVHATLAAAIVDSNARLGTALTADEREAFWREWRSVGRLVGVRDRDLPEDWAGFQRYFQYTVNEVLEDHPTVHEVFDLLAEPSAPPVPGLSPVVWNVVRRPLAAQVKLISVGLLPPVLRERFGMPWTEGQQTAFRALSAISRSTTPLLPPPLRAIGPSYVRMRRKQLTRGDVAAAPPPPRAVALN